MQSWLPSRQPGSGPRPARNVMEVRNCVRKSGECFWTDVMVKGLDVQVEVECWCAVPERVCCIGM